MAQWMNPGSFNQAQIDLQNIALNNDNLQLDQLKIKEAKMKLGQQEQVMQGLAGLGPAPSDPQAMTKYLYDAAAIEIQSGMPEQGAMTLEHADQVQHLTQLTAASKSKQTKVDIDQYMSILDDLPDNSAQSWAQAGLTARARGLDTDPAVKKILETPWSPGLIDNLKLGMKTAAQRMTETEKLMKIQDYESIKQSRDARDALEAKQGQLTDMRIAKLKKEGATNAEPKSAEINDALELIQEYYDTTEPGDLSYAKRFARDIASQAKEYQKSGMTLQEATNKAFKDMRGGIKLDAAQRSSGASKSNARTVPTSVVNRPPKVDLKTAMKKFATPGWYKLPAGNYYWDGQDFWNKSPGSVAEGDESDGGESDDE